MTPFPHERSIRIDAEWERVLDYVSRPENLPQWTYFFKSVVRGPRGTFLAETKVGQAAVKLPVQRTPHGVVVGLHVALHGGREVARILITATEQATQVTFQTGFPPTWSGERIAEQLLELEQELEQLRDAVQSHEERSERVVA